MSKPVRKGTSQLWAVITAIIVVLALVQATPLALFPAKVGDFAQGLAIGLCIVLVVVWLSRRAGRI